MQKNQSVKRLFAAGAVAVMFSAAAGAAQAQAVAQGTIPAVPPAQAMRSADQSGALDNADRRALIEMAETNMAEIVLGKIAVEKAVHPDIKAYAQRMVDEHTVMQAEVQALAKAKGVELPKDLAIRHKAKRAMLEVLQGGAFDRTYLRQAGRRDHRVVNEQLRESLSKIQDPDIRALAVKMQPIVERHLMAADALVARMGRTAVGTAGTPVGDTTTATGAEPIPNKK